MALTRQALTDALCQSILRGASLGRTLGRLGAGLVLRAACAGFDVSHDGTDRPVSAFSIDAEGGRAGLELRGVTSLTMSG